MTKNLATALFGGDPSAMSKALGAAIPDGGVFGTTLADLLVKFDEPHSMTRPRFPLPAGTGKTSALAAMMPFVFSAMGPGLFGRGGSHTSLEGVVHLPVTPPVTIGEIRSKATAVINAIEKTDGMAAVVANLREVAATRYATPEKFKTWSKFENVVAIVDEASDYFAKLPIPSAYKTQRDALAELKKALAKVSEFDPKLHTSGYFGLHFDFSGPADVVERMNGKVLGALAPLIVDEVLTFLSSNGFTAENSAETDSATGPAVPKRPYRWTKGDEVIDLSSFATLPNCDDVWTRHATTQTTTPTDERVPA